jgi:hypothetical protein
MKRNFTRWTFCFAVALTAIFSAAVAEAVVITKPIFLDGLQEVPPVATPGFGSGTITYDTDTMLLSASITYSDMIGTVNNSHFHAPGAAGVPAGVLFGLTHSGGTSGTVTGSGTLDALQESYLFDELIYVNIHSTFKSGGEIRGQVVGVPEPSSAMLGLLSAGGLAGYWRRRRRRALATA